MTRDKQYWVLQQQDPDSDGQAVWGVMLTYGVDFIPITETTFTGPLALSWALKFLSAVVEPS